MQPMSTFFNSLTEYSPQLEASDFMESEYLGGPQGGVFSPKFPLFVGLLENKVSIWSRLDDREVFSSVPM